MFGIRCMGNVFSIFYDLCRFIFSCNAAKSGLCMGLRWCPSFGI